MNDSVVAVLEEMFSDGDPLERAKAAEAVIGYSHAQQLQAFHQVFVESELGADPDGLVVDPTPPEVACAMVWSPGAASSMVDVAVDVVSDLPVLLTALAQGRIDLAKAREIATSTLGLEPGARRALVERAIDYAATGTRHQVRGWLPRQVDRIDPDAAERRRKKGRKCRKVSLTSEPDGMATLSAYLTAEEATACMDSIRVRSNNIQGNRDAIRADMFIELLTGITPAEQVPVAVIMTDDGAAIEGYGPIADMHADELLRRLELPSAIIRLTMPQLQAGYLPNLKMRRYVRTRDRHCRFPGLPPTRPELRFGPHRPLAGRPHGCAKFAGSVPLPPPDQNPHRLAGRAGTGQHHHLDQPPRQAIHQPARRPLKMGSRLEHYQE